MTRPSRQPMVTPDAMADAASLGIFIAPGSAFAASAAPSPAMRVNVAHGANPDFLRWLSAGR